jgi:FtsH-binding integral membrane protein
MATDRRYATRAAVRTAEIDVGLREYMLRVYNYMASGLAMTGVVAYVVASTPAVYNAIFGSGLMWLFILAPVGLVFFLSARIGKMSAGAAQATFWLYAALNGVAFSTIFLAYTGESIARIFFISASIFLAMSLYGYTTKRDISGWGSFLFMGLIGILIAFVVNIFLQSPMIQFVASVIGVLVFTGLTAYDTQAIKEVYYAGDSGEIATKKSIMGALKLYLDFINLFLMLLYLFGNRE